MMKIMVVGHIRYLIFTRTSFVDFVILFLLGCQYLGFYRNLSWVMSK